MLYDYNGSFVTDQELEKACRLYTAFQSGEIQPLNVNKVIAESIMEGRNSHAVTLLAAAMDMKRVDARKYLEENGKNIVLEYVSRTAS